MFILLEVFGREFRASWKPLPEPDNGPPTGPAGNLSSQLGFGFIGPDIDEPENRWTPGGVY